MSCDCSGGHGSKEVGECWGGRMNRGTKTLLIDGLSVKFCQTKISKMKRVDKNFTDRRSISKVLPNKN